MTTWEQHRIPEDDELVERSDPLLFEGIHEWFSLTYANYLTLPRSVLQSMPQEWQSSFVALLRELGDLYDGLDWPDYTVSCRKNGRFVKDPIPHYERGRTRVEPCPWRCPTPEELRAENAASDQEQSDSPKEDGRG